MVLCFQHFQWMRLDELLWFQYMENTKVTPVKINVALLLCFPHFHLVMKRYFCVFHISKYCIRGTFVFSIFSMLGMERTFVFSIYWKHKSWNRQKSKKVLLLRFVTFVTFVFYAHPLMVNFLISKEVKEYLIWSFIFPHFIVFHLCWPS